MSSPLWDWLYPCTIDAEFWLAKTLIKNFKFKYNVVEGIYIHIPFCSYKCPYCDFVSVVNPPVSHEEYVNLLKKEIELYRDIRTDIKTVYFGGGTPTLLKPEYIKEILEFIDKIFGLGNVEEITVECNPETYRYKEFKELLSAGVNRLSIGVQTFSEKGLKILGRKHSVKDSLEAFNSAREAGFRNINIDLIYAYPKQTKKKLERDLRFIEELKPEHVSAYILTAYEDTPLGSDIISGKIKSLSEEEVAELHEFIREELKGLGYKRYEISNWAKEGFECKHNLLYWTMKEFLGFGVSAWGFFNRKRYGNTRNINTYVNLLKKNKKPVATEIKLSDRDILEETVMLGLRLKRGVKKELLKVPEHLKDFLEERDGFISIKEEYMIVSNEIISDLLVYNLKNHGGR